MTNSSMCGVVDDEGRDCRNAVNPDAPINLCDEHFDVAFAWVNQNSVSFAARPPCPVCGERETRPGSRGQRCAFCDFQSPDYVP